MRLLWLGGLDMGWLRVYGTLEDKRMKKKEGNYCNLPFSKIMPFKYKFFCLPLLFFKLVFLAHLPTFNYTLITDSSQMTFYCIKNCLELTLKWAEKCILLKYNCVTSCLLSRNRRSWPKTAQSSVCYWKSEFIFMDLLLHYYF